VRATNTAPDSENKIHDDRVAAQYGFRGGLVPGVTVYGYMTVPVIEFAPEWLERGSMQVRFLEPFYDGDQVIVRAEAMDDASIRVAAEREDGVVCGVGTAVLQAPVGLAPDRYPEHPLPRPDDRPTPSPGNLIPNSTLGTVVEKLDFVDEDRSSKAMLVQFSNEMLVRNFRLGPWIHQFVVVDVMRIANGSRLVQTVRNTAIYSPRVERTT
jgi:hypothetical protein